jgi:hypothetical protein
MPGGKRRAAAKPQVEAEEPFDEAQDADTISHVESESAVDLEISGISARTTTTGSRRYATALDALVDPHNKHLLAILDKHLLSSFVPMAAGGTRQWQKMLKDTRSRLRSLVDHRDPKIAYDHAFLKRVVEPEMWKTFHGMIQGKIDSGALPSTDETLSADTIGLDEAIVAIKLLNPPKLEFSESEAKSLARELERKLHFPARTSAEAICWQVQMVFENFAYDQSCEDALEHELARLEPRYLNK